MSVTLHVQTRAELLEAARQKTLSKYSPRQCAAALQLYEVVRKHFSTSGGNAAAGLLLGLYNGHRFPYDLTNMRMFDLGNLSAALVVLEMDAAHTWCEIHVVLDAIRGIGSNTGAEFECWAYDLGLKKRCTKEGYREMSLRAIESRAAG